MKLYLTFAIIANLAFWYGVYLLIGWPLMLAGWALWVIFVMKMYYAPDKAKN